MGVVPKVEFDDRNQVSRIAFMLVRQADEGEVSFCQAIDEGAALAEIQKYSDRFKTKLQPAGDEVIVSAGV